MNCYVYLPETIDTSKTYQLIVGVHGANGNGKNAGGYAKWSKRGDVIVIGPSFISKPKNGKQPYQMGDGEHAKKLLSLFKTLKKDYKLEDKMFLVGFSGGSQFAHRFTMNNPNVVCGVAAHSGGSWATRGFGKINSRAKKIPFAISCGEKDTAKSFPQAPLGRLDWFKEFSKELEKKRFMMISKTWPGVGHKSSPGAKNLTQQCFQIATGLPGNMDGSKIEISSDWKNR